MPILPSVSDLLLIVDGLNLSTVVTDIDNVSDTLIIVDLLH